MVSGLRILSGPALSIGVGLGANVAALPTPVVLTLSITTLTVVWWMTEALPIPVTSLVPFVLFPATGVLSYQDAALGFGHHVMLLLIGGFMIAKGLERSRLHERVALGIIRRMSGGDARILIFGFMLAGASISMWISNTATCLMLMPIALAILKQLNHERLYAPAILAIAFSCNLGGIATLIGTPPNLLFAGFYQQNTGVEYSFGEWLKVGVPVVVIGLPVMALWLARGLPKIAKVELDGSAPWTSYEKRILGVFVLIAGLWVFRMGPLGGWSGLVGFAKAGDSTVAIFGVLLMFLIPSGRKKGDKLLDWETAVTIPWGLLLLFAGGLTIANALQASGTDRILGDSLSVLFNLPPFVLILGITLSVTFLTEITTNVAAATLMLPILAAGAASTGLPIEVLMIPATMSASCAFMLPAATAPNAIAFGTGHVTMKEMARTGFGLNILLAVIISAVCYIQLV